MGYWQWWTPPNKGIPEEAQMALFKKKVELSRFLHHAVA